MPHKAYIYECACDIYGGGSPFCFECGRPGKYDGWHRGRAETVAHYTATHGLKYFGAHRAMADELLGAESTECASCHGGGLVDAGDGRADCADCGGTGALYPDPDRWLAAREKVLAAFPDARVEFNERAPPPCHLKVGAGDVVTRPPASVSAFMHAATDDEEARAYLRTRCAGPWCWLAVDRRDVGRRKTITRGSSWLPSRLPRWFPAGGVLVLDIEPAEAQALGRSLNQGAILLGIGDAAMLCVAPRRVPAVVGLHS